MSNKQIFLSKQQSIRWMSDKYNWTSWLIALNILFFHCEFASAIIIQFNLPGTSSNSTINLQCNIIQDNNNVNIENNSELCKNASIDAIVTYRDETLVFKGDKYWRLVDNGIAPGYPQPISQKWPDLPKCINTAFTDNEDKYIYFFKGSKYWKYEGVDLKENFPRDIKKDFPGVPDNLQASLIWRGDNLLYLFKGDLYWAVDMSDTPYNVYDDKSIKEWSGIPGNLDAALPSYGSVTYFFKAGKYYKYDDKSQGIVAEDPPYPRRVASNWFGCPKVIKIIED